MSEHSDYPKMGGSSRAVIVVLVIIAIVVPIALGAVLLKGLPYSLPSPSTASQTSTSTGASSSSAPTVYLPQGAGSGTNFSPATLTVAAGTTITFVDQDTVAPHNVYFTSVPGGASTPATSQTLNNGDSYTVTLTTPGTYKFECQFHPGWMQGTITVTG